MSSFKYEIIDPKQFARVAAEEIVASIQDVLSENNRCVIALAGGSTPVSIYRDLTIPPYVDQIEWKKLDLIFGDERWVPKEDTLSNFRMVNENLVSRLGPDKPRVHPVNTELATPQLAADQYCETLKFFCNRNQSEPVIDLVLLGLGEDGHMASLFPGCKSLEQDFTTQPLVAVEDWPGRESSYRVTLTPRTLLAAQKIIFFVKGHSKVKVIANILDDNQPDSLPAHIFRKVKNKVRWLVDSEAGTELLKLTES